MALTACYMYNSHIDKVNLLKVIDVKAKSGISLKLFVNILEKYFYRYSILSKPAFQHWDLVLSPGTTNLSQSKKVIHFN